MLLRDDTNGLKIYDLIEYLVLSLVLPLYPVVPILFVQRNGRDEYRGRPLRSDGPMDLSRSEGWGIGGRGRGGWYRLTWSQSVDWGFVDEVTLRCALDLTSQKRNIVKRVLCVSDSS